MSDEASGAPEKWPRDRWLDELWDRPDVKPNERVVAYAYARFAGDGDVSWCVWEELRRRTGIKSRDALARALAGLKDNGWLKEVEKARQHYSARYRLTIPQQSAKQTAQQSAKQTTGGASSLSGETRSSFPETSSPSNGPDLSNGSLRTDHSSLTPTARLANQSGATEREINQLAEKIRADRPDVRSPIAWLTACHRRGDLTTLLAQLRGDVVVERPPLPEPCGQCEARPGDQPSARMVEVDGRLQRCPRCHPSVVGLTEAR